MSLHKVEMKNPEESPEYKIEEAVIISHKDLGYDIIYPPIRRVLLYRWAGIVDLILLPKEHKHRLVLIEAKHSANAESGEKVIGQLLKYYAYALRLGENGLNLLANFSETNTTLARGVTKITPQKLSGGLHRNQAMPEMEKGEHLRPEEIGLFVAVNHEPESSLLEIVNVLKKYHKLDIGIIQVAPDGLLTFPQKVLNE